MIEMAVTANQVKELREATGVGMMDCKKALEETGGDMNAAVDWLRTRGLAKAAKKAGRVAAEGLVGVSTEGTKAAIVEVNSETDFVARNDQFQGIVGNVAKLALDAKGSIEKLAEKVATTGCQLVLAPDSEFAAAHAAAEGLIPAAALAEVRMDKAADRRAPASAQ